MNVFDKATENLVKKSIESKKIVEESSDSSVASDGMKFVLDISIRAWHDELIQPIEFNKVAHIYQRMIVRIWLCNSFIKRLSKIQLTSVSLPSFYNSSESIINSRSPIQAIKKWHLSWCVHSTEYVNLQIIYHISNHMTSTPQCFKFRDSKYSRQLLGLSFTYYTFISVPSKPVLVSENMSPMHNQT